MGRLKGQAFARPMIEPIHNAAYLRIGQRVQGHAFGHIRANQPVGVFVESALPRMVGTGKIDGCVQRLTDGGMDFGELSRVVGKLQAVIGGTRLGMLFMGGQQRKGGRRHRLGVFGGHFAQQGIARAPFDHRDQRAGAPAAQHQVDFPIADAAFFFYNGRALVDANAAFNLASALGFAGAFFAFLLAVTQLIIQRPARLAIRLNMLVDTLRTQPKSQHRLQSTVRLSSRRSPQSARDSTADTAPLRCTR